VASVTTDAPASLSVAVVRPTALKIAIAWATALAATALADLLVRTLAVHGLGMSDRFPPFMYSVIAGNAAMTVTGAAISFTLIAIRSANPMPAFRRVAIISLALSLVTDAFIALGAYPTWLFPGASPATSSMLVLMNIATFGFTLSIFGSATRPR
jgi:hypothetical protein